MALSSVMLIGVNAFDPIHILKIGVTGTKYSIRFFCDLCKL